MKLPSQIIEMQEDDVDHTPSFVSHLGSKAGRTISTAGSISILGESKSGFFCSSQCPGPIVLKTFDVITQMRDAGKILIGGFHSVMEWECLGILLRGRQPVIWVPARSIVGMRLKSELVPAFEAGRLLVLSPFQTNQKRVTAALADERNRFVAALADRAFIPHAAPGSKTLDLAQELAAMAKPILTIRDPLNEPLFKLGAFNIEESGSAA